MFLAYFRQAISGPLTYAFQRRCGHPKSCQCMGALASNPNTHWVGVGLNALTAREHTYTHTHTQGWTNGCGADIHVIHLVAVTGAFQHCLEGFGTHGAWIPRAIQGPCRGCSLCQYLGMITYLISHMDS